MTWFSLLHHASMQQEGWMMQEKLSFFLLKKITFFKVAMFGTAGSVIFFLLSNLFVLIGGFGLERPKTFNGLMLCYNDALVFYRDYGLIPGFYGNVLIGDLFFTGLLFGGYYLVRKMFVSRETHIGLAN